jgi:hypothetical protein
MSSLFYSGRRATSFEGWLLGSQRADPSIPKTISLLTSQGPGQFERMTFWSQDGDLLSPGLMIAVGEACNEAAIAVVRELIERIDVTPAWRWLIDVVGNLAWLMEPRGLRFGNGGCGGWI